jgi:hypothetical protein
MFNTEPTSRLGVSCWVCRLTGKLQRRKLKPAALAGLFRVLLSDSRHSNQRFGSTFCRCLRSMAEALFLRRYSSARTVQAASAPPLGGARLWRSISNMESSMSRATILALSLVAALALSSGAMAQGAGAGGGGGGAGGASGASGTTTSGSRSGTSGNSVAQPSGGQSSPTGNTAAQPPGSTGQNSINSPGTGVGPGPSPGSIR